MSEPLRLRSPQGFVETWGEAHLNRVKSWFLRARADLSAGGIA